MNTIKSKLGKLKNIKLKNPPKEELQVNEALPVSPFEKIHNDFYGQNDCGYNQCHSARSCSECDDASSCYDDTVRNNADKPYVIYDPKAVLMPMMTANLPEDSAANNEGKRGIVNMNDYFEEAFPWPYARAVDLERANYTRVIDKLMEMHEDVYRHQMEVALNAKRAELETLMEFNLQAGMHREAVVMCTIVEKHQNGQL